ncbi:MAG: hypothetical protein NT012_00325 [Candidatus Nealsonbacteria bacterium]|nr:hypothetical protein [Candidatus Nealsonbacteria bacterium]
MITPEINKGKLAEQKTKSFLKKTFFEDFIFDNPKVREGRYEREICDLLILFDDALVVVQCRTKSFPKSGNINTYIRKTTLDCIRQLKFSKSILFSNHRIFLSNNRRGSFEFDKNNIKRVFYLVVLEQDIMPIVSAREAKDINPKIFDYGFTPQIFDLNDFMYVVNEFDTPTDFFEYLEQREKITKDMKFNMTDESELVAYYRIHERHFKPIPDQEKADMVTLIGFWEEYKKGKYANQVAERVGADRISYYIDDIIEKTHTSKDQLYIKVATILGRLRRLERRMLAKAAIGKAIKAAKTNKPAYRMFIFPHRPEIAFLFLYTPEEKNKRRERLFTLTACTRKIARVKEALGIASEPINHKMVSFDFCIYSEPKDYKVDDFENKTIELCKKLFRSEKMFGQEKEYPTSPKEFK